MYAFSDLCVVMAADPVQVFLELADLYDEDDDLEELENETKTENKMKVS